MKNKKFNIFFDPNNEEEMKLFEKLSALSKNRRNYLILDLLTRFFNGLNKNEEKLIDTIYNLSQVMVGGKIVEIPTQRVEPKTIVNTPQEINETIEENKELPEEFKDYEIKEGDLKLDIQTLWMPDGTILQPEDDTELISNMFKSKEIFKK
jgi:hypothetical protein